MEEQEKVAEFIAEHDLQGKPAYRILDLASEVGEIAKDAVESGEYGATPEQLEVNTDEVGDVLFSLLAVAESLDIDASVALDEALDKYQRRLKETGTASSQ